MNLYSIDRKSPSAIASVIFMLLSVFLRTIYCLNINLSISFFIIQFIFPISAALIFITIVLFFGEGYTRYTSVSVLLGVIFFICKSFSFTSKIHTTLCIILYLTVLLLYSLTVWGVIKTKYLLYPLFALPLLYHIFVEDMKIYILADPPVPFLEWLPEISVLCIMAALLSVSISLKKVNIHEKNKNSIT